MSLSNRKKDHCHRQGHEKYILNTQTRMARYLEKHLWFTHWILVEPRESIIYASPGLLSVWEFCSSGENKVWTKANCVPFWGRKNTSFRTQNFTGSMNVWGDNLFINLFSFFGNFPPTIALRVTVILSIRSDFSISSELRFSNRSVNKKKKAPLFIFHLCYIFTSFA